MERLFSDALGLELRLWEPNPRIVSAVLCGRNFPLERSLAVLAEALQRQFPRHVLRIAGVGPLAHHVLIPAFLGKELRLYTIDLVFAPDRKKYSFRCTRHVVEKPGLAIPRTPRIRVAGSGAQYLAHDTNWIRRLLRMVRAHDRGQVPARAVADHFAGLNNEVHRGLSDKSVGPRCIVAWRHRKGGVHNGGGAHEFYTGTSRDASVPPLPSIASGVDMAAFSSLPHVTKMFEALGAGVPLAKVMHKDEIDAELAGLPDKPDENPR